MKKINIIFYLFFLSIFQTHAQNCADQIDYYNTSLPLPLNMPVMLSGVPYNEVKTIAIPTHFANMPICTYVVTDMRIDTANCTNGILIPNYNVQWETFDDMGNQYQIGDTVVLDYNFPYKFFCTRLKSLNPPSPFIQNYTVAYKISITNIINMPGCVQSNAPTLEIPISIEICNSSIFSCPAPYTLQGHVYSDNNTNCSFDANEYTSQQHIIKVTNTVTQVDSFYTTYPDGFYRISLPDGNYIVQTVNTSPVITNPSCFGGSASVTVVAGTAQTLDIPVEYTATCEWVQVDLGTASQTRCAPISTYLVQYRNIGSIATSGILTVDFPEAVRIKSTTISPSTVSGNTYTFDVVNLQPGETRQFWVVDSIDCNAAGGVTVCPKAVFSPLNACNPPPAQWDGSTVDVTGSCNMPNVNFVIKNSGVGNMSAPSQYRVYQNGYLFVQNTSFQLNAGDSIELDYFISGATFHLEADQVSYHPRQSLPRYFIEACGPGSNFTLGNVATVQQDDLEDDTEICCTVTVASYDPNDKQVFPIGEGDIHAITRRDELEYMIRFQNTGTGPAYTVRVEDVLDLSKLDINTLTLGATSHHYIFNLSENGKATWTFPQIALPDSSSNPLGSIGFLKFKIKQKGVLPWGTIINNQADIYFDSNPAILTNNTFNTVDSAFKSNTSIVEYTHADLSMFPNPTNGQLTIDLSNINLSNFISLNIINVNGKTVMSEQKAYSDKVSVDVFSLKSGIYIIQVKSSDGKSYRGRFVKL